MKTRDDQLRELAAEVLRELGPVKSEAAKLEALVRALQRAHGWGNAELERARALHVEELEAERRKRYNLDRENRELLERLKKT